MRLAYEQGLLRSKNLNHFQHWALLYWIYLNRRQQVEDMHTELVQQTYNLFPERWTELYRAEVLDRLNIVDPGSGDGPEIPLDEGDLDEMDRFLAGLDQHHRINAAELGLPPDWTPDPVGIKV